MVLLPHPDHKEGQFGGDKPAYSVSLIRDGQARGEKKAGI
jgi:hypothetical protein